jgi:hypothetical protein
MKVWLDVELVEPSNDSTYPPTPLRARSSSPGLIASRDKLDGQAGPDEFNGTSPHLACLAYEGSI